MPEPNPRIAPSLRAFGGLLLVILVLAGIGLLFDWAWAVGVFAWPLKPFNQRFLGAIYSGAMVASAWLVAVARWSPARTVDTMVFVFATVVTPLSFVHLGQFDFARWQPWGWFVVYLVAWLAAGLHLAWPRGQKPVGTRPVGAWRRVLSLQAAAGVALGLLHLAAPGWIGPRWPWPVDVFHTQVYSVAFFVPAAGALCLLRAAAPPDLRALGSTQLAWGLLPVLGLWLAEAPGRAARWDAPMTWAWLAVFGTLAGVGAAMWRQGGKVSA